MTVSSPARPQVLRVLPAPETDPRPLADRTGSTPDSATADLEPYVQGTLAVDFRDAEHDSFFGPQATSTPELPPAEPWAHRMILAILESLSGQRPAEQLSHWLAPTIRQRVQRRFQLSKRRGRAVGPPPQVRLLRSCHPTDGACEVTAVVVHEGRVRALALRLCGADGRWLITAWELG